jgi:YHS domain-containing protein
VLALLRGRVALSSNLPPRPEAALQDGKFVNPVCGLSIDTTAPKHVENYEGVAYYFCCDGCWTTFKHEPAKYAAIHRASVANVSTLRGQPA